MVAAMVPGRGPRRFVVPGHHLTADDLYGTVSRLIGRRRPHLAVPAALVAVSTTPVDWLNRALPRRWRFPADREAGEAAARDTRFDTSPAESELHVTARPLEETLRDMLTWLVDSGRLPERYRPA